MNMIVVLFLFGIIWKTRAIINSGSSHDSLANPFIGQPTPKFISRGSTFRVVTGDIAVLPCEVQNLVAPDKEMNLKTLSKR